MLIFQIISYFANAFQRYALCGFGKSDLSVITQWLIVKELDE